MADSVDGYCAYRASDEVRNQCAFCDETDQVYSESFQFCKRCDNTHSHRHYSEYGYLTANLHRGLKSFSSKHEVCDEHGKKLDKLCCEHYDIVCERCWRKEHTDCYVKSLKYLDLHDCSMFRKKQNEWLMNVNAAKEQKIKDIEQRRVATIKVIDTDFRAIITKLRKQVKKAKDDINELFKEMKDELQDVYNKFTKEFQALNEVLKKIEQANSKNQTHEASQKLAFALQRLKTKSKDIYKPTKAFDIPEALTKFDAYIDELFATDAVWDVAARQYSNLEDQEICTLKDLQVLQKEENNVWTSFSLESPRRQFNILEIRASGSEPILAKTNTDKDDCCITGLCITINGHLLMSDCYNKSVKLFSKQGKYITSCVVPGEPWDITTTDHNEAAVTLWDNQKAVLLLRFTETSLLLHKTIKLKNRVSGIAAVEDHIAVTSDDTIPSVILITKDGLTVWSKQFDASGKRLFVLPGYIVYRVINGASCLFVSDKEKHVVTTLDAKSGEVLKVIMMGKAGPNGLSFDNFGNVFIGNSYIIGVCIYSSNMDEHKVLLSEQNGTKRPLAIVFNSLTSELLVSSWKSNSLGRCKVIYN